MLVLVSGKNTKKLQVKVKVFFFILTEARLREAEAHQS